MTNTRAATSVGATATNDFVHRGISLAEEGIVYQANIELQTETGWYVGAWLSRVNFNFDERSSETDFFAGYQHRWSNWLATDLTYIRYTYDKKAFGRNYDWNELQFAVHLGDRWSVLFGTGENWLGRDERSYILESTFRQPFPLRIVGYVNLGHQYADNVIGDEYWYGEVGLARGFGNVDIRIGYHDVSNYGGSGPAVESKVVVALSYSANIF